MKASIVDIELKLNELCTNTSTDFSAIALLNKQTNVIQWKYVSGNTNERYKHMIAKPGKDLSGAVFRFGRVIVIDEETIEYERKRLDYPIMLAERLQTAVAVPIISDGTIVAVLLVGSRTQRKLSTSQKSFLLTAASVFSQTIHQIYK